MKRIILIFCCTLFTTYFASAQSSTVETLTIQCSGITSADDAKSVSSNFTSNYADRVTNCSVNLPAQTLTITSNLGLINILQVLKKMNISGYYVDAGFIYKLSDDGAILFKDNIKPQ